MHARRGTTRDLSGEFWRLVGMLIPGEVDHIIIYVGPAGRCVEAGARGRVIEFEVAGNAWDAAAMMPQRGPFLDVLHGVAYPLAGRAESESVAIRRRWRPTV